MTTLHESPPGVFACAKGAPEVILEACARQLTEDGEVTLDARRRDAILATAHQVVDLLPAAEVGCCVLTDRGELCRDEPAGLASALADGTIRFHAGSIRGAVPRVH